MLTAEILYPDSLHGNRKCSCIDCGLSYVKKDYEILANACKLKYFTLSSSEIELDGTEPDVVVCHNCLFKVLKDFSKDGSPNLIKFLILTKNQEIELEFNTDQFDLLQSNTVMDDFLASLDRIDAGDTDEMPPHEDEMPPHEDDSPDW